MEILNTVKSRCLKDRDSRSFHVRIGTFQVDSMPVFYTHEIVKLRLFISNLTTKNLLPA